MSVSIEPSSKTHRQIKPREHSDPCPLSCAQQRLWFLSQLEPESTAYNEAKVFHLEGSLDLGALRTALDSIVARHEVLRTTFVPRDGTPVQIVGPSRTVELSQIDLSAVSTDKEQVIEAAILEVTEYPIDLSHDLMLRAALLRLSNLEHVLVLVTHHMVSDGWSVGIIFRELTTLYEAYLRGKTNPLADLPIQYADYALWQHERLRGDVLERLLCYWRNQLAGMSAVDLPADRPRPAIQTHNGAKQSFVASRNLAAQLQALSRREGATLFMILLAAFQALLHRYTGQLDIAVGVPTACRTHPEIEGLIGFFVNNLVLRGDLSGNPSFRELLSRVRTVALGAFDHQELPFEKLVEVLHPERNLSRSPLFQIFFNMTRRVEWRRSIDRLTIEHVPTPEPRSKFDMTLYVREKSGDLGFDLVYNRDLFYSDTMSRMLSHYRTLLDGIVANPDSRVSDLPILTQAEKQQLLIGGKGPAHDPIANKCVHELFEAQVERTPNAVAALFEDKTLTYAELNQRSNQVAYRLHKLGIGPEVVVGLCVERSFEMVVGLLGILKAGGAYVPLDPEYPQSRLAYMTEKARVGVLLTTERLLTLFPDFEGQVLCLDQDGSSFQHEEKQNPRTIVRPDNLSYVIYTSGSTGKPKGVLGHHGAVANYFSYLRETYDLKSNDKVLQIPSLSFDASLRDLIGPLTVGAQVVIVNAFEVKDAAALVSKIKKYGVTCILSIVPTLLNELVESASTRNEKFESLRLILASGEALPMRLCQKTRDAFGDSVWIVNQYGPTESTLTSNYYRVSEADWDRKIAPLGKSIPNVQMYILDGHLNPVPVGIPGEVHIGGVGITRGYVNSSDLTAERFIPDFLSGEPGARLYKTGDLARHRSDGAIEFLGRIDHQVKIRGNRVELGEIESVIAHYPGVEQSLVMAREDVGGLIAYIIPKKNQSVSADDLRYFLKHDLPEYMVPSDFISLDAFPLTPNRKVDRAALPVPEPRRFDNDKFFIAPRNPVEQRVADIWTQILKRESVGILENFFYIGGHSLLAMRLVSRISREFAMNFPLRKFFENPTIADVALQIEEIQRLRSIPERLTNVLASIETLSDEEAELLLVQERSISRIDARKIK